MRRQLALLIAAAGCAAPAPTPVAPSTPQPTASQVVLDGELLDVDWDDGDTFAIPNRNGKRRQRARLEHFNTLESYGPVHQWGDWTPEELYALAKEAGVVAKSGGWHCARAGHGGGYGRIAVSCPELAKRLLHDGLAHVFSLGKPGPSHLLAAQLDAQKAGRGMWAKGVPDGLITSLHSIDERRHSSNAYDRVVNSKTGEAPMVKHAKTYAPCDRVCHQGSCMIYIPYKQRYGRSRTRCGG
jgi:micrococcal nuclease